jgi:hypothetical protein
MLRKLFLSIAGATVLLLMLSFAVLGQSSDTSTADNGPRVAPTSAVVTQTVPLSLTVLVPGPDGTQTITVPIFLNLDLRIDISSELTASVAATATADLTSTAAVTLPATVATPTPQEETEEEATPEPVEEPVAEATPAPAEEAESGVADPATETVTDTESTDAQNAVSGIALLAACPNENVRITSPAIGATVSGVVAIEGTANNDSFQYYKVEYISGEAAPAYIGGGETAVVAGPLSELDTSELPNGPYSLLLTVVDNSGNFPDPCAIAITVENE